MPRNVLGLAGRLAKLRAMSPGEVAGRLHYRTVTMWERRQYRRGALARQGDLHRTLLPGSSESDWRQGLLEARKSPSHRFFAGASERGVMQKLFAGRFESELKQTRARAGDARENRFCFFGRTFHYQGEIDWQRDPVSGAAWPSVYHGDVPVHGGDVGFGDVKYVWELSRQQYVIDLAKSFYLAHDDDDLGAMRRLVRSWINGNSYATGVNWSCALEPAFRVWSWLWAYHLAASALDDDFHLEWLRSFYDHGRFISRHLEHYSSPYNHLIGEAAALYALGVCFPEFKAARQWRRKGRAVLEQGLSGQFYRDGGSVEQSTFYHHATTGFYLLAGILGRANGEEFPDAVWNAIERALEFSMHLSQPDGYTPAIGGADDGKPIRMEHLPFWDFRPYQAIGAVLFGRPDFKRVAGRFHEDALWLLGRQGLDKFDGIESAAPCVTSIVLPASGYAISRSGWEADADYLCFDVGEQAAGMRTDAVPNSMHGHADALSVLVCFRGRRVLIDSGLYAYNCGGEWEAHFRETAAHNTARIDGRDQARHIGKMAWSHSYRAAIESWMADDRQAWVVGSHDGYARGPNGVTHRRTVWRRPGGYILLHDEFVGNGTHTIELNYQFAPGELQLTDASRALFDGFAEMCWVADGSWSADVRCGGDGPADGWICSSLGVRRAAPRLRLKGVMSGGRATVMTILTDGERRAFVVEDETGSAVAIRGDRHTDWVVAAGLPGPSAIATDARLAVCRVATEGELERSTVGGTMLMIDRERLEAIASAAPWPAAP